MSYLSASNPNQRDDSTAEANADPRLARLLSLSGPQSVSRPRYGPPDQLRYGAVEQQGRSPLDRRGHSVPGQPGYGSPKEPRNGLHDQGEHDQAMQPGHGQPEYDSSNRTDHRLIGQPGYGSDERPEYRPAGWHGYLSAGQPGYSLSDQRGYGPAEQSGHDLPGQRWYCSAAPGDQNPATITKPLPALEHATELSTPEIQALPWTAWTGLVMVTVALGTLGQAWVGYEGWTTGSSSALLWYLTLCLIFTPSAALILSRRLTDQAKVWFSLYMSLALFATRFILYPSQFVYHDELMNYRVLLSIEHSHHLFTPNSLLPDTADYPGMEIATAAVHQITGLSLHLSGILILAAVRVITTLALIRIIQRISKSVPIGCLAALIYATNPQYIFFNSQFAYQSVALPLCFFCIYVYTINRNRKNLLTVTPSAVIILAVAATHHLTSLALVIVLWTWYLISKIRRRPTGQLFPLAVIGIVIVAAWTWLARSLILPYINEIANNGLTNITSLVTGQSSHKFFTDSAGDRNPIWQDILSLTSVLLIMSALIPSLCLAVIKHRLLSAAAMVLFVIAAIYPMVPAGHLTNVTAEISDRASGFVFVGIGYIVAAWWFREVPFHRHGKANRFSIPRLTWLLVLGLTVCFVGGAVLSGPDWIYGPGRYLVSADNRSVDQLALQAAYWEGQNLPPGSRVYADRVNGSLAAVYGNQTVLTPLANGIDQGSTSTLLLRGALPADSELACAEHIEFLIADVRLASSLPHLGLYIDNGEYLYGFRRKPPSVAALTKFDNITGAQRIFDNGAVRIYDLRGLTCAGQK